MVERTVWGRFLALFYPERCSCCGKPVCCGSLVCENCYTRLVRIAPPLCPFCGANTDDCGCGKHRRHTERCIAPFYHETAARTALHRLKFGGKSAVAEFFGLFMAQTVQREYADIPFDCVVPVPISPSTQRKRTYNQSAILARDLSKRLDIPCEGLLVKRCETMPQRELPAYRRSGNVLGVFEVEGALALNGRTILLVDDTVTTGATLDECAKILKLYGAQAVYAVTATASRLSNREN